MTRSVLVTGASGFIGFHVTRHFHDQKWSVSGIDRNQRGDVSCFDSGFTNADLNEPVHALLERIRPDLIVHLAAPSDVARSMIDPAADLAAHIDPFANLLETVRVTTPATRVLLVSSAAVYGDPIELPVSEDAAPAPLSAYGFHKVQSEMLLREYVKLFSLHGSVARVFSTFGEGQRRLAVYEIARRALRGDPSVHGRGDESRDYLYAPDIASALQHIAECAPFEGEAFNVASGDETSIRDLASLVFEIVGFDAAPRFTGSADPDAPKRWRADVTRLHSLGFRPQHSLRDALERTIAWIRADG